MNKYTVIFVSMLFVGVALVASYSSNDTASLFHFGGSGALHDRSGSGSWHGRSGSGSFQHSGTGALHPRGPSALSKRLGISDDQIRSEIKSGKSIEEIAKEHNVSLPDPLQQLADRLKISKDELQKEMSAGKPLMQILKEHGMQVPAVASHSSKH